MAPVPGELEVGRIGRAHGLRGEVSVTFVSNRPERAAPGAVLHAGDRVLVIVAARRHQGQVARAVSTESTTARSAEALHGALLTAEPLAATAMLDDGEFWVHELIGSPVVDTAGNALGRVVGVEANPAHDLSGARHRCVGADGVRRRTSRATSSSSIHPMVSSTSDACRRLHDLHRVLRQPAAGVAARAGARHGTARRATARSA